MHAARSNVNNLSAEHFDFLLWIRYVFDFYKTTDKTNSTFHIFAQMRNNGIV